MASASKSMNGSRLDEVEISNLADEKTLPTFNQRSIQRQSANRMPAARRVVLSFLFLVLFGYAVATAVYPRAAEFSEHSTDEDDSFTEEAQESTWTQLLDSASPAALHEILHAYFPETYKHGVYASDQLAMEVVHANDAALATSLVELAKRQDSGGNGTTTTAITEAASPTSTDTPAPETTTSAPQSVQETTSTTSPAAPVTTSTAVTAVTSTAPGATTETTVQTTEQTSVQTTLQTSMETSVQTTVQTTVQTRTSAGTTEVVVSTIAPTTAPSSAGSTTIIVDSSTSTGRSSEGQTSRTTKASQTPVTSTFVSTLGNGGVTTITSVTMVDPPTAETMSSTEPAGTLQTGNPAAHYGRDRVLEVIAGAVIGGALLV